MRTIAESLVAFQSLKSALKTAIENKGVIVGDASFISYPSKVSQISGGFLGTLSFTGTYATALSDRVWAWAFNSETKEVLLILQGANSTSYENVRYSLESVPTGSGITLKSNYTGNFNAGNPVGGMYGCILQNVTQPINISIAVNTRNSTYDFHLAEITVTYV